MFKIYNTQPRLNDVLTVIIFVIVIAVFVGLSYYLAKKFLKENKRFREDKDFFLEGVLSKAAMMSLITGYIYNTGKKTPFSLLFVDIDKFSEYNNAFGQKEGDKILEKIGSNIKNAIPKNARVGRYQADQFTIFLGNEYSKGFTIDIANKIKTSISKSIVVFGDTEINPTASISIAFYPLHGKDYKELVKSLQVASYVVKKQGGNGIKIYSEEQGEQEGQYVDYYYQIKSAISKKEFTLYFQPMIHVKDQKVFGFEALLRWNHPEFGVLPPFKFLNVMEQSGDIQWVGLWGLETIIKTSLELKQDFPNLKLSISMNLSPKQLMSEDIAIEFNKIIRRYRVEPQWIILEIVEFAIFDKQDIIFKNIEKLHNIGFRIAIDGFGLEYSTLSKVEKLPIDILKLHNDFLKTEEAHLKAKFAELLVEYAKMNQYLVIAENIEDQNMAIAAQTYHIHTLQGYYYSQPMSSEDVRTYLKLESWKEK